MTATIRRDTPAAAPAKPDAFADVLAALERLAAMQAQLLRHQTHRQTHR